MKQELEKLKKIREALLNSLNELDELIEKEGDGLISGKDIKLCLEREEKQMRRGIDPPPEKPPHGN